MLITSDITTAVTADIFKQSTHLMLDDASDDALIDGLLLAAQGVVEAGSNRPLTPRTAELHFRAGCGLRWWFPCAPVESVSALHWLDAGVWQELSLDGVWLERGHDEPQMVLPGSMWEGVSDGADVRVTASIGHQVAPQPLVQAMILIAADWYEAGINPDKADEIQVAFGARALMKQSRYDRPRQWWAV